MRVLIACEFSGRVRDAFALLNHDAWSCDLMHSETPGQHIRGDVLTVLDNQWDLMIAHPPCTYLAASGARWWRNKQTEQRAALDFAMKLLNAPIPRIALENPIGRLGSYITATQIIQPYYFGHPESKATCLWLKNLPKLIPTSNMSALTIMKPKAHYVPPGPLRQQQRSRTYPGVATAMAQQWSNLIK